MDIVASVSNGMVAVEEALLASIDSDVRLLHDASLHILSGGGKRVRPRVALLAYLAAGGTDLHEVVPMAAAIEMVHTATLVHDDINDHSLTRRGQASVHAVWGRTFALLTGDYLFTKVYELMAPYGAVHNTIMAEATTALVEGETLQAAAAKEGLMDRETYKKIISRKTASLFEAGARMAAIMAGASEATTHHLADYAYNLGLTFQIVDDILDIVGDPEAMGKPVGADVVQGRGIMVAQNGRLHGQAAGEATAVAEDPVERLMASLRESGAVEIARMQAQETASRALSALNEVSPSPARQELARLVDQILERDQ